MGAGKVFSNEDPSDSLRIKEESEGWGINGRIGPHGRGIGFEKQ